MIELKEAVKILRKEVRMTQKELSEALGFSCSSIKRWEGGVTIPDTSAMRSLMDLAERQEVSAQCKKQLKEALSDSRRYMINLPDSALYSVERESICQLVDDSHNAVYVCDLETDEMLYVNHRAIDYIGKPFLPEKKEKCYQYIYNRSQPCLQCLKTQMLVGDVSDVHMVSPLSGRHYHVRGRKLNWNGRPAHAQYFFDETDALENQTGFKSLVNQLGIGIFTCWVYDDGTVQINYMSDGYFAIVGSSREKRAQFAGFGVMNALCDADSAAIHSVAREAAQRGESFSTRYRVKKDDGTLLPLYMRATYIRREGAKSLYYCSVMELDGADMQGGTE